MLPLCNKAFELFRSDVMELEKRRPLVHQAVGLVGIAPMQADDLHGEAGKLLFGKTGVCNRRSAATGETPQQEAAQEEPKSGHPFHRSDLSYCVYFHRRNQRGWEWENFTTRYGADGPWSSGVMGEKSVGALLSTMLFLLGIKKKQRLRKCLTFPFLSPNFGGAKWGKVVDWGILAQKK